MLVPAIPSVGPVLPPGWFTAESPRRSGAQKIPKPDKITDVMGVVHEPLASLFVGAVAVPDDA